MIDFTSTRAGASTQDKACSRLLVAVIVSAIRDASLPLSADCHNSRTALAFLFGPDYAFSAYARLIGSSADAIRRALLQPSDTDATTWMHYPTERRQALQARAALEDHF